MPIKLKAHHNGDDVFLVWRPSAPIKGCRGFAVERKRNGKQEILPTWMGFETEKWKRGTSKPSTTWPVQKFSWVDFQTRSGDRVAYRVIPMVGEAGKLTKLATEASAWTSSLQVSPDVSAPFSCYFNRGIVAAQWVQRLLGANLGVANRRKKLDDVIVDLAHPERRNILAGQLRDGLLGLLDEARKKGRRVDAALFELTDGELIDKLAALKSKAHVVLADGSYVNDADGNLSARKLLRDAGVNVHNRETKKKFLAHNKILVVYDGTKPRWTWTGSLNWSPSGLCSQANNSVLIDDRGVARHFAKQVKLLSENKGLSPQTLAQSNSTPRKVAIAKTGKQGARSIRTWFTRTIGQVEMADAKQRIAAAKEGIVFLMFMTGAKGSLLEAILKRQDDPELLIHGVISSQPQQGGRKKAGAKRKPTRAETIAKQVAFVHQNERVKYAPSLLLPFAREKATEQWFDEFVKKNGAHAIVHSKLIVIDPFGKRPVVITGSHNMGVTASKKNDENLVIIEGDSDLAAAYAVNALSIYNNYRWRFRLAQGTKFKGLYDDDRWQKRQLAGGPGRELSFWGV